MTKILKIDREAAEKLEDALGFLTADEMPIAVQHLSEHREQATRNLIEALQWCVDYFDGNTRCNAKQMDNCVEKCRDALTKANPDA